MKTPTPLTDEQIDEAFESAKSSFRLYISKARGQQTMPADGFEWHYARAIEAAVNAQWVEMLAGQEPVATLYSDGYWIPKKTERGRLFNEQLGASKDVYTHPKPDDTALLRQALKALLRVEPNGAYEVVDEAIAALEARLK